MAKNSIELTTYGSYEHTVKRCIVPYFEPKHLTLKDLENNPKVIQDYYQYEILEKKLTTNTVITASFYGLRRSEVVGLKWNCIDFDAGTITIRHIVTQATVNGKFITIAKDRAKNKSSLRTLPLVAPFREILLRIQEEQAEQRRVCGKSYCTEYLEYIYLDPVGKLIRPDFVTQHFSLMLDKNDFRKIRFHDLRHSCASLLFSHEVSLKEIQEWLGHSNISTTANIYTHMDFNKKISSANAIIGLLGKEKESTSAAN